MTMPVCAPARQYFHVTQRDITNSLNMWPSGACPVELALLRTKLGMCSVDQHSCYTYNDPFSPRHTPSSRTAEFVNAFDTQQPVKPFRSYITLCK